MIIKSNLMGFIGITIIFFSWVNILMNIPPVRPSLLLEDFGLDPLTLAEGTCFDVLVAIFVINLKEITISSNK